MKKYIEKYEKGTSYVKICKAVGKEELTADCIENDDYKKLDCVKFIPASGAATRMFKDLYEYVDGSGGAMVVEKFVKGISDFAFYEDLKALGLKTDLDIVKGLLDDGLGYGKLPKALIKFHQYDGYTNVPIDEHVYEGRKYLNPDGVRLHFTISPEHEGLFNDYVRDRYGDNDIEISYSFQKKETDTLAVDLDNKPFLLEDGSVLYRAGGHGALIENLNDIDGDVIFVKNIDNVCHQSKAEATIEAKKKLAAIGYSTKMVIDRLLRALDNEEPIDMDVEKFIKEVLNVIYNRPMSREECRKVLDRPLRVCGVVRNEGEPGGGPYVVDHGDYRDLQILEMAEIDMSDEECQGIVKGAKFFNPVDLVCFVKDYKGDKYDLRKFVNEERYFVSEKSYKGRKLKALEHPGLWNGAMDNWNTLFVEVPIETFNPVKTVMDLIRDGHRG